MRRNILSARLTLHRILSGAGLFIVLAAFVISGCSHLDSPLAPEQSQVRIPASKFKPIRFLGSPKVGSLTKGLDPGPYVEALITALQGGRLTLDWENKDANGVTVSKIIANITISPNALERDTNISINLPNPAYVDLEFGESGTQFRIPAVVKLDMEGLNLSGYSNADEIDLYWYDLATNSWVLVPKDYKEVHLLLGKVTGVWHFDHFSRYSLGGNDVSL